MRVWTIFFLALLFLPGCSCRRLHVQSRSPDVQAQAQGDEDLDRVPRSVVPAGKPASVGEALAQGLARTAGPQMRAMKSLAASCLVHRLLRGAWPDNLDALKALVKGTEVDLSLVRSAEFQRQPDGRLSIDAVLEAAEDQPRDMQVTVRLDLDTEFDEQAPEVSQLVRTLRMRHDAQVVTSETH